MKWHAKSRPVQVLRHFVPRLITWLPMIPACGLPAFDTEAARVPPHSIVIAAQTAKVNRTGAPRDRHSGERPEPSSAVTKCADAAPGGRLAEASAATSGDGGWPHRFFAARSRRTAPGLEPLVVWAPTFVGVTFVCAVRERSNPPCRLAGRQPVEHIAGDPLDERIAIDEAGDPLARAGRKHLALALAEVDDHAAAVAQLL